MHKGEHFDDVLITRTSRKRISIQCQVGNDIEYEFPCFNLLGEPSEMWAANDRRFDDPVYGGILLAVNTSTGGERRN